jgi:HD superfamily phosphohydrolase
MASTKTSKVQQPPSHSKTLSSTKPLFPARESKFEDLGYFYDTIHGRVAFGDLPTEFQPALRIALGSSALDRLTRISQLGHTSLTYFSATQTRFSHAIGTLLMMNRLFLHLWPGGQLLPALLADAEEVFPDALKLCFNKSESIRCHLLLAALFQDCGELPFQKITSLYLRPHHNELNSLQAKFGAVFSAKWKTKEVFTLRALCQTLEDAQMHDYDLKFLGFLITGTGAPESSAVHVFRQMMDGPIDADRLDYVFRDALLTIGSVSKAEPVLNSIIRYERDHVVVDDPRPAADFLSTRARLWTFVYTSPDVRFRQALLKAFLQAGFSTDEGRAVFRDAEFVPEVTLEKFLRLDDHSMLQRIRRVHDHRDFSDLAEPGRKACEIMLKTVTEYECRILPKPNENEARPPRTSIQVLPNDLFFDLLLDHDEEHKLYAPKSVRVDQSLTQDLVAPGESVPLEDCCGALGPIFLKDNRAPLIRSSYFLFRPKNRGQEWNSIEDEIRSKSLYEAVDREDINREIHSLTDTWERTDYKGKKVAISCAFEDRPTIVRIIRELQSQKQHYRLLLDSLLGLGNTALQNSRELIQNAESILVIASRTYLSSAVTKPDGNIAAEVKEIYARNTPSVSVPVVVAAVDSYDSLKEMDGWSWSKLHPEWKSGPPILIPLRHAGDAKMRETVEGHIKDLNKGR